METQAGGPGAFARFDLDRVPSPCFVVDEVKRGGVTTQAKNRLDKILDAMQRKNRTID